MPEHARLPRNIKGSSTCHKSTTWDRRLYFPSEGRLAEDFFFALKNPNASAGFEPANLGTKGQHATSRPPKPHPTKLRGILLVKKPGVQSLTKRHELLSVLPLISSSFTLPSFFIVCVCVCPMRPICQAQDNSKQSPSSYYLYHSRAPS